MKKRLPLTGSSGERIFRPVYEYNSSSQCDTESKKQGRQLNLGESAAGAAVGS